MPVTHPKAIAASSKKGVVVPRQGKHISRVTVGHHKALNSDLQRLKKGLKRGDVSPMQLYAMVKSAVSHAEGVAPFLTANINRRYHVEADRDDGRTAAQKVFSIPELVQEIVLYLDIPDIVAMSRVNTLIRRTIDISPYIKEKLSLVDAPTAWDDSKEFYAPFASCLNFVGGFVCEPDPNEYRARMVPMGNVLLVKAKFILSDEEGEVEALPTEIGSAWRKMFICQPPPTSVKAYVSCCNVYSYDYQKMCDSEVFVDEGITIGDLLDSAKETLGRHGDHYRNTELRFEGYVPVDRDDEVLDTWSMEKMKEFF